MWNMTEDFKLVSVCGNVLQISHHTWKHDNFFGLQVEKFEYVMEENFSWLTGINVRLWRKLLAQKAKL